MVQYQNLSATMLFCPAIRVLSISTVSCTVLRKSKSEMECMVCYCSFNAG